MRDGAIVDTSEDDSRLEGTSDGKKMENVEVNDCSPLKISLRIGAEQAQRQRALGFLRQISHEAL